MPEPVSVEKLLVDMERAQSVIVDVRSESEFEEAHIPGAISLPLFNDAERAEVGTIYKQQGPLLARQQGLEIVVPKIPGIAEQVCRISRGRKIVFYCWRGGERSKSVAKLTELLGFESSFLIGGHKAFRKFALNFLNASYPFGLCTLFGLTGCAKTKMIQKWKAEGKPVIDLEALAHHRGSAFGQVGIEKYGRQKDFENNLFWEMWRLRREKTVVIEGESRRIGRCQLPETFLNSMLGGIRVRVDKSIEARVEHIMSEYVKPVEESRMLAEAGRALDAIKKRLGGEKFSELQNLLNDREYARFTRILLTDYYDKMYKFSRAPEDFYHLVIHEDSDWALLPL